ncbi:ATP-binding protein [Pararhizobium mangrovi]|uniref:ATP-binding protein n=1 Tax=Pararhizobium mangrovi TaxID=2590452 RepID=A0A506UCH5_9HYPH|nr:ATP-binding protein [Pararhizobium mangrovi]TPW30369.1 ATP-binding protein [Pararhizobium mangrovi]
MQVDIEMGSAAGGSPATLDLEELLATRLLVQGNSGSGKSHLLRRLLEQSAPWVQQCVIDPEGDFVTLADRFGHVVVDASRSETELAGIAARVRKHRVSAVLNLEGLEANVQMRAAAAFLNGLFEADRAVWYPMLVVVDEAQMFAPTAGGEVAEEARRISLSAMTNLMCRGRKRGLAGVIATQRLAKLAKNVAAEASNFLMGRTFLDIDMARAADLLGMDRRQAEKFRDLARGTFVALGPALARRPLTITIGTVETQARSTSPVLMPLPEAPADASDLIFAPGAAEAAPPQPQRVAAPVRPTQDILGELARARPAGVNAIEPSCAEAIDPGEREAALDGVIAEMVDDPDIAFRPDAMLYQDFLVRCRIARVPGSPPAMQTFRRRMAVARAGVDAETAEGDTWQTVLSLSTRLPEEMQSVFLTLARSALAGLACPGDATLARIYGTHSQRRARRLLTHLEEHGVIVLRTDLTGRRIAALPDIGCETAPGDPNAHDVLPEGHDAAAE